MKKAIDFYFDFTSPYGYLMAERIDAVAARFGRTVRWHPILLGVIFKITGSQPLVQTPLKAPYTLRDIIRSARFLEIPYQHPSRFPIPTQAACRTFYWLDDQDHDLAKRFAIAAYRALFRENCDISLPENVVRIATGLGVDANALNTALALPEIKLRLQTEGEVAIAHGVFGSPYLIIDDEPFFGVDRLPQIERWLAEGAF